MRAVRALQSADVILFDDLVSKEVLDFARREARRTLVGKSGHGPSCKQSEINTLMVGFAKAGRRVVRLKGGDPMIFGRAGEESTLAAPLAFQSKSCRVSRRRKARRAGSGSRSPIARQRGGFKYITGHGEDGAPADRISIGAVSPIPLRRQSSICRKRRCRLVENAIAAGLDPATPAIAIAEGNTAG